MKYTQFAIFEITHECNLAAQHRFCPSMARIPTGDGAPLTDTLIVDIAVALYNQYGFAGMIGWHYYCEPMLAYDRIKRLTAAIREKAPQARFVLWSNGTGFPSDPCELRQWFDAVHITAYKPETAERISRALPEARVWNPAIDDRLDSQRAPREGRCYRMFTEFIVDAWGTVHGCCYDWRGEMPLGNLHTDGLDAVLDLWQATRARLVNVSGMTADAPPVCHRCPHKCSAVSNFDNDAHRRAVEALPWIEQQAQPAAKPWVIAVAYRMPVKRVRDFLKWNHEVFTASGAEVVIVVERPYSKLGNVRQVVFKEPMTVFSLCKTKNAGIQAALDAGAAGAVIASDIDIVYPPGAWSAMVNVAPGRAVVPLYLMASGYSVREDDYVTAPLATGTVAMHAQTWRDKGIRYNEQCKGYGSDDAILLRDIRNAGLPVNRCDGYPVYHIAHTEGTPQKEFAGRSDHWNRDSGFNPENFAENNRIFKEG